MKHLKHTPIPWACDEESGTIYFSDGDIEPTIATVNLENTTVEQGMADILYIVHCVNLHEELVKALERIQEAINLNRADIKPGACGYLEYILDSTLVKVRAA